MYVCVCVYIYIYITSSASNGYCVFCSFIMADSLVVLHSL